MAQTKPSVLAGLFSFALLSAACSDSGGKAPALSDASRPTEEDASTGDVSTPAEATDETVSSSSSQATGDTATSPEPGDAGALTRAQISASEGGSIESADGVFTLIVPPDALTEDTELSIRIVPEEEWPTEVDELDPVSSLYDVQPDGLRFAVPAVAQFEWQEAPAALQPAAGEFAVLGDIYSRSADGEVELSGNQLTRYAEEGSGVTLLGEVEHLSGKWVGTSRGCRVRVEAPVGSHFVGSSFSTSTFELECSAEAAAALEAVRPLASSSATSIVSVAFGLGVQADSVFVVNPGNADSYRPGRTLSSWSAFPLALTPATWECLEVGSSNISAGVGLTRNGSNVAVVGRLGSVTCTACDLSEQDCSIYQVLNIDTCKCDCLIDGHEDCPDHQVFNAETCECRCIADPSDCADNQNFDAETCECVCAQSDADCGAGKHVDAETCECACDQVQECDGAFPTFSEETCACVCEVTQEDCEAGLAFDPLTCSCRCPEAIAGNAACPSDLQYYDTDSCQCSCIEDEPAGSHSAYCAQFNKRFDEQACDCVCDLDPTECSGNLLFDDVMCQCYCPEGDVRNCDAGYLFDETACGCVCDMAVPCEGGPDFARNPETCACECILDEQASCFPAQVLNPETCECECDDAPVCDGLKVLNETECACECNPALPPCTPPLERDPESCECVCEQSSACPAPTPHFNTDTCACECDITQLNCTAPTPYADFNTCSCVPHVFYFLIGQIVQTGDGCSDADGQFTVENVTDTGFDVVGLTTNGPKHFNVTGPLQASGSGITLFNQGGHSVNLTFSNSVTPLGGSGSFFGSGSGSCSAVFSFARQ